MSYPQTAYQNTTFASNFISRRREVVYANTLLYQLDVLKKTGRYDAFKLKWHPIYDEKPSVWPVPDHMFWDSDVAKWIEGACYFLQWKENQDVRTAVDELVQMIKAAQQEDGYLNLHYTVVEPGKRFTNLRDMHELYNAGHLIEAALAHNAILKSDELLEPILKYVKLLAQVFGPGPDQKHGYPGHPEIELALLRLWEKTQDPTHLALGSYFLKERGKKDGHGKNFYDYEAEARGESVQELPDAWPEKRAFWYQQAHKPIVEQETIEGHSVRAMYLLTAVADLERIEKNSESSPERRALEKLWSNMVDKKMSLTGGIGSRTQWEGFGIDYFLPQGTDEGGCYNETCAGIGVMMLAERLLQIDLDGKYADVMELCLYNAVMTSMSADGKRFTYVNQLASSDNNLSKRAEWFTCACCPPNVTRLLGYIGGYLWSYKADESKKAATIKVHLYSAATLKVPISSEASIQLQQESNWPWEGKINFALENTQSAEVTINLRIPAWAKEWSFSPPLPDHTITKGYLTVPPAYLRQNPNFTLNIPLTSRLISPHPYTNQDNVALARGPLIYCVEDVDNSWVKDHFKSLLFDPKSTITEKPKDGKSDGIGEAWIALTAQGQYSFLDVAGLEGASFEAGKRKLKDGVEELHFVPYGFRDNRGGNGHMRVGLRLKH